jgi:hypothetical protein
MKDGDKVSNIPILIEVQVYEVEKTKAARVSMRGGNGSLMTSLYQLFITFFG